jgi:hypothetical protein
VDAAAAAHAVAAADRLVEVPAPAVMVAGPVGECRPAARRGQVRIVPRRLAHPVAAVPRNCRAADLGQRSAIDLASVAVQHRDLAADQISAPVHRNGRREEHVPVERVGRRFRR